MNISKTNLLGDGDSIEVELVEKMKKDKNTEKINEAKKIDINQYCLTLGLILIVLGGLHLIFTNYLSYEWGVILIIIGIISLVYRSKVMIRVFGISLIVVGVLNILTTLIFSGFLSFWIILGIVQIVLGIQEYKKFKYVKENSKYLERKKREKG